VSSARAPAGLPSRSPEAAASPLPAGVAAAVRERAHPVCLYVYDLHHLRDHVRRTRAALPPGCKLLYAMKANSEAPLLRALAPLVDGFEAASLGEVERARAAAPGAKIALGGPAKTDAELHADIDVLHLESATELLRAEDAAARLGRTVRALLRVNPNGPLPAATLRMGGAPTQFGIDESELPDVLALARRCPHVHIRGLHFHSISNNLDADAHGDLVALYLDRAARLGFTTVNAGGGIGVDYADPARRFDWPRFTARLAELLAERPVTLVLECGRYLTADCGFYAAEVLDLKRVHGIHFALVRGGTHHLRLPASWQHSHPFTVLPLERWEHPFPRPELRDVRLTVAGQLCSPKDVLARGVPVERIRVGDVIVFRLAGAYGWSISHHDFLSHPHPDVAWLGA
jgi:diaminopimelate decarboxylase